MDIPGAFTIGIGVVGVRARIDVLSFDRAKSSRTGCRGRVHTASLRVDLRIAWHTETIDS